MQNPLAKFAIACQRVRIYAQGRASNAGNPRRRLCKPQACDLFLGGMAARPLKVRYCRPSGHQTVGIKGDKQ